MQRKNITIKDYHQDWIEDNSINLSQFVQGEIDDEISSGEWEIDELIHEPGVTIGRNAETTSRVVFDRFRSPAGYNVLVLGDMATGKTHGAGYHFSQRKQFDNTIVCIDPMNNEVISEQLDGRNIHIGGEVGLNPLRVEPFDGVDPDIAGHLTAKSKMKMLEAFFATLNTADECDYFDPSKELESALAWPLPSTLNDALEETYERVGISLSDPSTLSKPNPTIQDDLIPVLEEYQDVGISSTPEAADRLLSILEPFKTGNELSQFGGKSELSLSQNESTHITIDGDLPEDMLMALLFGEVGEWAKQCEQKSIIAIDDSRHLLRTKEGLEAVEQSLRHSRHHNTSYQIHTLTVEPFKTPEGKAVLDQFAHRLLYQIQDLDDQMAALLDLTETQAEYIRNAHPGDETRGFAEAAFTTPGRGWFPIRITAD